MFFMQYLKQVAISSQKQNGKMFFKCLFPPKST